MPTIARTAEQAAVLAQMGVKPNGQEPEQVILGGHSRRQPGAAR